MVEQYEGKTLSFAQMCVRYNFCTWVKRYPLVLMPQSEMVEQYEGNQIRCCRVPKSELWLRQNLRQLNSNPGKHYI